MTYLMLSFLISVLYTASCQAADSPATPQLTIEELRKKDFEECPKLKDLLKDDYSDISKVTKIFNKFYTIYTLASEKKRPEGFKELEAILKKSPTFYQFTNTPEVKKEIETLRENLEKGKVIGTQNPGLQKYIDDKFSQHFPKNDKLKIIHSALMDVAYKICAGSEESTPEIEAQFSLWEVYNKNPEQCTDGINKLYAKLIPEKSNLKTNATSFGPLKIFNVSPERERWFKRGAFTAVWAGLGGAITFFGFPYLVPGTNPNVIVATSLSIGGLWGLAANQYAHKRWPEKIEAVDRTDSKPHFYNRDNLK